MGGGPVAGRAAIPAGLRFASLCTGVVGGELVYDRAALLAQMRQAGLSDDQIASALAVNAVAQVLDAYFFLTEEVAPHTRWYRLADGSVGVCADDEAALRERAQDAIGDVGEALASLDLRAYVLGGDTTDGLVRRVLDAYESIEDDLGPYCGGAN